MQCLCPFAFGAASVLPLIAILAVQPLQAGDSAKTNGPLQVAQSQSETTKPQPGPTGAKPGQNSIDAILKPDNDASVLRKTINPKGPRQPVVTPKQPATRPAQ